MKKVKFSEIAGGHLSVASQAGRLIVRVDNEIFGEEVESINFKMGDLQLQLSGGGCHLSFPVTKGTHGVAIYARSSGSEGLEVAIGRVVHKGDNRIKIEWDD